MAFFEETGDEFITDVRKFETTDKAHADLFNNVCGNLYNNDVYLRKNKVDKIEGKGLSTNDYTNSDKDKLAGIEERANKYVHPETHTADIITQDTTHRFVTDTEKETWNNSLNNAKDYADATYQQATGYTDNKIAELIGGAPETLDTLKEVADAIEENKTVVEALDAAIGKKANQAELDTHIGNSVIHVTSTDKSNWNAAKTHAASAHAPADAEVNQNAFSNVVVGSTTIAADSKTDTLTFAAGRNITLTPDANNDKITVSLTDKCTTITDWNLATANGWYMGRGADNSPSELVDWWYGLVIAYSTMFVRQILYRFATDNNVSGNNSDRYERIMQNGVWGTWVNTSVKAAVPADAKFTDTTYSNATTTTAGLMSANDKLKLDYTNIAYGTCSTAAATSAKVITLSGNTKWTLQKGSVVIVKFTNTNTASSVTLNVNNTGAKRIWVNNAVYTGTSAQYCGYANRNLIYVYDGTYWVWIFGGYDSNTTYSNATLGQGYGTCTTAEATTAKVVTLSSYNLVVGGIVAVKFTYAVPANSTMNINSRGAKAIYYRGAAISAGIIKAGDIGVFIYNGTQYHLLSVDRNDSSQSVGNGTITITQNGTAKGTFTTNQSGNTTIALTDNNTTYSNMAAATASAAGKAGLVPAPSAGAQAKYLRGDGTWQVPTNTTYSAAGTSLGLVKTGGDVTISNGTITVNDDSHNHTIANIDNLQATLNGKAASSHTHNYIPLSGSSAITGNLISSTDAQKNLGDRTHVWNEVWAKSVKVKGNYGDDETYGIAYNNGDNKTELIIGNLDDIEGGSNSQWVVVTDDCRMCNSLEVEGSITGTGVINLMKNLIKKIYPVGSIYISTVSTNPSILFGFGTWTQIKDTFLLAAGTTYKAGSTGGEATHKLTVNEMPAHTHQQSVGQSSEDFIVAQGGEASWVLNGAGTSQTGSTGGSAAHNNMPPYLAVYVWKRTA